jgi:hypothetical protein
MGMVGSRELEEDTHKHMSSVTLRIHGTAVVDGLSAGLPNSHCARGLHHGPLRFAFDAVLASSVGLLQLCLSTVTLQSLIIKGVGQLQS